MWYFYSPEMVQWKEADVNNFEATVISQGAMSRTHGLQVNPIKCVDNLSERQNNVNGV